MQAIVGALIFLIILGLILKAFGVFDKDNWDDTRKD